MLLDEIKSVPMLPGVYEYFDKNGRLLYVGKAKNLKNRIKSYFAFTPTLAPNPKNSLRIQKMISEAVHLEFITTNSEGDALILENSFIKQLHPKYNILLRDDKTYPYIYVDLNDKFPRFELTRKVIKGAKIRYFGPYFRGGKEILNLIYSNYQLAQKKSCLNGKKACIFYQIGRCKAPCEGKISSQDYAKIVLDAIIAIKNPQILISKLSAKMQNLAMNENYEEAAKIRDEITLIRELNLNIEVDLARLEDFEVVAIVAQNSLIAAVRFSIKDGKISAGNVKISRMSGDFEDLAHSGEICDIYKQFLLNNFMGEILDINKIYVYEKFTDIDEVAKILSQKHGKKIEIIAPKTGDKRNICDIAYQNGEISIKKYKNVEKFDILREIKEYFKLENLPINIEGFDNSQLFGSAIVGAMVSYSENGFNKNNYRHFHLQSPDDYGQMKQMLSERAKRFDKLSPPDLWVIDGGKALFDLANLIVQSSGANIDIIAIAKEKIDAKAHRAKGGAKDKIYTKFGEFLLPQNDKKLQFIQKIRDEAHRFVITFHQNVRKKRDLQSSKLRNLGVSEGSIAKLINYFGTFDEIYKSDYETIAKITNTKVADKLFFNKKTTK